MTRTLTQCLDQVRAPWYWVAIGVGVQFLLSTFLLQRQFTKVLRMMDEESAAPNQSASSNGNGQQNAEKSAQPVESQHQRRVSYGSIDHAVSAASVHRAAAVEPPRLDGSSGGDTANGHSASKQNEQSDTPTNLADAAVQSTTAVVLVEPQAMVSTATDTDSISSAASAKSNEAFGKRAPSLNRQRSRFARIETVFLRVRRFIGAFLVIIACIQFVLDMIELSEWLDLQNGWDNYQCLTSIMANSPNFKNLWLQLYFEMTSRTLPEDTPSASAAAGASTSALRRFNTIRQTGFDGSVQKIYRAVLLTACAITAPIIVTHTLPGFIVYIWVYSVILLTVFSCLFLISRRVRWVKMLLIHMGFSLGGSMSMLVLTNLMIHFYHGKGYVDSFSRVATERTTGSYWNELTHFSGLVNFVHLLA